MKNGIGKTISKKKLTVIVIAAAVVLLVAILAFVLKGKSSKNETFVYAAPVSVIMNPGNDTGVLNRFAGVVEAQKTQDIVVNQEKTVKEVYVEVGEKVSVGTVLFTYDTDTDTDNLEKGRLELERLNNDLTNKKAEIEQLKREKGNVGSDAQLDYTIQIQSAEMELKQTEYGIKTKEIELEKLEQSIANADVKATMSGTVKSIRTNDSIQMGSDSNNAFMSIIGDGAYRVKGKVNEQNMSSVIPGQPVIVHSRVDADVIWKGKLTEVDRDNPGNDSNQMYFSSGDSTTQSNSYPFYVELESSTGLMLGQHVYVEMDYGQEEPKEGLWLDESYICREEDGTAYVWKMGSGDRIRKQTLRLGEHDEDLMQYEILDGLTKEDAIAWPDDGITEGMKAVLSENGLTGLVMPGEEETGINNSEEDLIMEDDLMTDEDIMTDDGAAAMNDIAGEEAFENDAADETAEASQLMEHVDTKMEGGEA